MNPLTRYLKNTAEVIILGISAFGVLKLSQELSSITSWGRMMEFPIIALAFGMLWQLMAGRSTLRMLQSDLPLKAGIVMLGAGLSVMNLFTTARTALLQALVLIPCVLLASWFICSKLKLKPQLKAVMSTALAVCGVSAAVAAAGAVMARRQELSYVTALVVLWAMPLMLIMPWLALVMGLEPSVAGAWFGGNIDTTAAVVGAGTIHSPQAQEVAIIVKSAQNALIGPVAFCLALWYSIKSSTDRPTLAIIWQNFPKFLILFMIAIGLNSLGLIPATISGTLKTVQKWLFAAAFVLMGREFSLSGIYQEGPRAFAAFSLGTLVNTTLALGIAWMLFSR